MWLAACVMQSALGPAGVRVTAIELPSALGAADVYATLPALEPLHTRMGVDEARLLSGTRGAFTLGQQFVDTTGRAASFFHAYGSTGARIDRIEFLPQWLRARRSGLPVAFEDFCATAMAAKHGRMLLPDADIERHGFTDYGYHLPAIAYAAWLKHLAQRRGVTVHEARTIDLLMRESAPGIASVALDQGRAVSGDFFIDATGEAASLISKLEPTWQSWRETFPVDRLLTAHAAPIASQPVFADVRAGETGWLSLHPTQVCTHVVHAYSRETPDDLALEHATKLARLELHDARIRSCHPGRREMAWQHNCVAVGAAACRFDAVHDVELQGVQLGLVHLLPLFPVDADFAVEREEYNQNIRSAFDRLRDFQAAHYVLNRYGGAFWERARLAPVSKELLRKIGVFRARGDVVYYEDESFGIDDWQALLLGHGVMPETWDPAADRSTPELVKDEMHRILAFIRQKVGSQRTHADYLRSVCVRPAPPPTRRPL
jgi:tryptophan halogenase